MSDNLFAGSEVRDRLMRGVTKAADAVGSTMGPAGSNALISCLERPGHFSTNDGATILGNTKFEDPIEEIGRQVLLEAVSRANKKSGDGSSTTCVLTSAILSEGMKHMEESSPMEIKKSLEDCIPIIEKSVSEQKRDVIKNGKINLKLLEQVATIASEDTKMGKMVARIYSKIGAKGVISWDISKTAEDSYTLGTGITVNGATYAAPYMCDDNSQEARRKILMFFWRGKK